MMLNSVEKKQIKLKKILGGWVDNNLEKKTKF